MWDLHTNIQSLTVNVMVEKLNTIRYVMNFLIFHGSLS